MPLAAPSHPQWKRACAMSLRQRGRFTGITPRILSAGLLSFAILFVTMTVHGQPAPQPAPATAAPAPASTVPDAPEGLRANSPSTAPPPLATAPAELPRDLTPFGMFMSADIIVKAVMLGLIFASVLTWTIWLAKTLELFGVRWRLKRAQRSLSAARSLVEAAPAAAGASRHVALLIHAVEAELARSADRRDVEGIKERIAARFERIEAGVGRKMMRATGILATIGATAPFVGLFGTVWGIMNSFIGI